MVQLKCVTKKQTLRSLSLSYQKRMVTHGRTHPSFGMTPFLENVIYEVKTQILKSRCHTKRKISMGTRTQPSFDMTTTKTLRPVFS